MKSAGSILTDRILAKHGARPDLRLWRNETAGAWVGRVKGRTQSGDVVLTGASMIQAGLFRGSPDLVGVHFDGGRFIAIEVKAPGDRLSKQQGAAIEMLREAGAIVIVAQTVEDVTAVLGEP